MTAVPLGELIKPTRAPRAGQRELPLLSMTMHDGLIDQSSKFKKRVASADTSDYKVIRHGQLVVGFPIDEGVLDFQTLYKEAIVSPAYGVWDLSHPSTTDTDYLKKFLCSPRALAYYKAKLRGSTARRRSLPAEIFLALPVPLPTIEKQRRIAAILDQADALRAKHREAAALLNGLGQSIFIEMFGHADPSMEIKPLSDVVAPKTIVTYGIVQAGDEWPGGIPYIRTGDIVNGRIRLDGLRRTDPSIASKFDRSRVTTDDIVMSIRATVGTTALVTQDVSGANLTQGTARISPGPEVRPLYLLEYLRSDVAQRWIQAQVKSATFREITLGRLRQLPVPVPPHGRQEEFVRRVKGLQEVRTGADQSIELFDELFSALEARAFTGRL